MLQSRNELRYHGLEGKKNDSFTTYPLYIHMCINMDIT
jgi:hypothetical protein